MGTQDDVDYIVEERADLQYYLWKGQENEMSDSEIVTTDLAKFGHVQWRAAERDCEELLETANQPIGKEE